MKTLTLISLFTIATLSPLAAQDWARAKLEKSPRHHEWVQIKSGERNLECFVVFPEKKEKATAVIVIHENKGLTDWVRTVADELAANGYLAIAPDFLSGTGPNGGNTGAFPSQDAATKAIYTLNPDQITADLNAAVAYITKLPAANGKVAVGGFCWGGSQTFRYATNSTGFAAGYVFYGTGPDSPEAIAKIGVPVYGFYGEDDARVNATIPKSTELMTAAGKTYEPITYAAAGHGFMRSGEEPNASEANAKAREAAWKRWLELLGKL